MKSNDSNGNQMSPNTNTKSNTKTNTKHAHENGPLADDQELIFIQGQHDALFEDARQIGLTLSDRNMSESVRLFEIYGFDAVKSGIDEASRLNKISIAYIEAVAKNYGKPREDEDEPDPKTFFF